MKAIFSNMGLILAHFLTKPLTTYEVFSVISLQDLCDNLLPCDLLLVEGNNRISTAIKYLTQSTWSHVALYLGKESTRAGYGYESLHSLLEVDLVDGVITVPLSKYDGFNLRICRPINLSAGDKQRVLQYATQRLGYQYDLKNIFDLLRYLLPTPPIPSRFRRNLIAFGSGDPTKAICSSLIAQAFQAVQYPILPRKVAPGENIKPTDSDTIILQKRHHSHFTPRDFDLSPYFEIVKPTIRKNFDYTTLRWDVS